MTAVLLAVPELAQEPALVSEAASVGLRVARRCVDVVDLLAAAAADPAPAIVVSPGLPRLSAQAVSRLRAPGDRRVVGLAGGDAGAEVLRRWGIDDVLVVGPTPGATLRALAPAVAREPAGPAASGVWPTGAWPDQESDGPAVGHGATGRIVAVWGPIGSPGRTTVAIGVAEALGESGLRACVVDADTYAPSVALFLGMLDDAGGLAMACRHADNGSLTDATLLAATRRIHGSLHVLAGLSGPDRWAELRAAALSRVWEACRSVFDVTVVDVGFCLEDDEGAGPLGRHRNTTALSALAAADHVIGVADASTLGAARLVGGWAQATKAAGSTPVTVVRNRATGGERAWVEAVRACGVSARVCSVPADQRAVDECWRGGRSLGEGARRSRIRRALAAVATVVVPP